MNTPEPDPSQLDRVLQHLEDGYTSCIEGQTVMLRRADGASIAIACGHPLIAAALHGAAGTAWTTICHAVAAARLTDPWKIQALHHQLRQRFVAERRAAYTPPAAVGGLAGARDQQAAIDKLLGYG